MSKSRKIPDTNEAWETGQLGRDEEHVAVAEPDEGLLNAALGMLPISIRLEKSLIEDFKLIAQLHGLSYQPLMRQALRRFAESEKRRILRDSVCQAKQDDQQQEDKPQKRVA